MVAPNPRLGWVPTGPDFLAHLTLGAYARSPFVSSKPAARDGAARQSPANSIGRPPTTDDQQPHD